MLTLLSPLSLTKVCVPGIFLEIFGKKAEQGMNMFCADDCGFTSIYEMD